MCLTDTRFKEDGVEYISPTNRFYGSQVFAPHGKGLSKRGYTPDQEGDALCNSLAKNECEDPCAYKMCNENQSYTVQCPDNCYQAAGVAYGNPDEGGILGPYEDTSAICRAAILSGKGTNDDSFYTTFTIVAPVRKYQDPGGVTLDFYRWDKSDLPRDQNGVNDKCCHGGWPPQLGYENNRFLKFRNAFFNEWQNVRAFAIEGSVKELCPTGYKFKQGTREAGDPACIVSASEEYTPVEGCDECVKGTCNIPSTHSPHPSMQ